MVAVGYVLEQEEDGELLPTWGGKLWTSAARILAEPITL